MKCMKVRTLAFKFENKFELDSQNVSVGYTVPPSRIRTRLNAHAILISYDWYLWQVPVRQVPMQIVQLLNIVDCQVEVDSPPADYSGTFQSGFDGSPKPTPRSPYQTFVLAHLGKEAKFVEVFMVPEELPVLTVGIKGRYCKQVGTQIGTGKQVGIF